MQINRNLFFFASIKFVFFDALLAVTFFLSQYAGCSIIDIRIIVWLIVGGPV